MTSTVEPEYSNIWLASYPKSGNTWFRLVWRELTQDREVSEIRPAGAPQPGHLQGTLLAGIDLRQLSGFELLSVRAELERSARSHATPIIRKTHERFMLTPSGAEVFPTEGTHCALVIIRDPRDVVASFARHYSCSLDEAIDSLCREVPIGGGIASRLVTAGGPGAWWQHVQSWVEGPNFPVRVSRYEDFRADPVTTFADAVEFCGLSVTRDQVAKAVQACEISTLREREQQGGFTERIGAQPFFGEGKVGSGRSQLTASQVAAVEQANGEWMTRFGYDVSTR
jgi:hypothetical protein